MRKHIAAIINPIAGSASSRRSVRDVARALQRRGGRLHVEVPDSPDEVPTMAGRLASEFDALLAVGGDGTVSTVVNGLIGCSTPIAVLSAGTENLVARELGMPVAAEDVARLLLHGPAVRCDVGLANGRRFLVVAGVGFDAECVERLSRDRQGHITHLHYFWPIWRTYWSHRFPEIEVQVDGHCLFEGRGAVIVGNMGRYAAGMRILANASYGDGLLDVCVLPCESRRTLTAHAVRVFLRRHVGHGGVQYRQGRLVEVRSTSEAAVQIDGDIGGAVPLRCSILPDAVQLLQWGQGEWQKA